MEGSQILNLGHVTLTTRTLGGTLSSPGKYLLWWIRLPNMKYLR